MNNPLISVVIPAYNCSGTIIQSIDSVLAQDVKSEIIVVDDCSTDNTAEIIIEYVNNGLVKYIKNETNKGVAFSRNRGVTIAKGKYIAFLDADDLWAEGKLKKQLDLMENNQSVLCATGRELINPDGSSTGRIIPIKEIIAYGDLLKQNPINCSSVLIKTEVALEFPMHSDDCHEDYIMWLEVLSKYKTACGINEPLLKYRMSNKGKSGNKLQSAKMTYMVYRKIGFNRFKALWCFCRYAFNGVKKYFF